MKKQPRNARMATAIERAITALEDVKNIQTEYQDQMDSLPENLAGSTLGEKLQAICDVDISVMIDDLQGLES